MTSYDSYISGVTLIAIVFLLITGFFGILFAISSMLGDNEIGAGVCLVASALAFSFLLYVMVRREIK